MSSGGWGLQLLLIVDKCSGSLLQRGYIILVSSSVPPAVHTVDTVPPVVIYCWVCSLKELVEAGWTDSCTDASVLALCWGCQRPDLSL